MVTDAGAVTHARVRKNGSTGRHVSGPDGLRAGIEPHEELVSVAITNAAVRHARKDEAIGAFVGAVRVVRIDVYEPVAGTGVVSRKVQEGRATKTVCELPVGPRPA